jgi:plasmid stability protein
MAQLIVRNVDERVVRQLKIRAAQHGRSMEAEHREILRQALTGDRKRRSLKEALLEMPNVGKDEDFARTSDLGREVAVL